MNDESVHAVLRMLKKIRSELSRDAWDRAGDRVDELIARLERESGEEGTKRISTRDLLDELSKLIPVLGSIARFVDAILKQL